MLSQLCVEQHKDVFQVSMTNEINADPVHSCHRFDLLRKEYKSSNCQTKDAVAANKRRALRWRSHFLASIDPGNCLRTPRPA
jgi:hypothetical protein